jgi:hypothetical protein
VKGFLSAYRGLIIKLPGAYHNGYLQHLVAVHYERLVLPLLQRGPPSLTNGVLELIAISRPCTLSPERLREVVQRVCHLAADSAAGSAEQATWLYALDIFMKNVLIQGASALCLAATAVQQPLPLSLSA